MCCAQPCCFCLEFLLSCVSRDPGGSLLLFSTHRTGCSRRTPPSKRRLRRRLESCAKLARLVVCGVLAACVEDVLADMEQPALPTDIGVGPIVSIGTPIIYPASSLPASSSYLRLPPPSPPLEFSTSVVSSASGDALSVGKATAKRVRSRKVEKGKAKRTAQMVDEVESGGEVLGNAGGSLVGQMVERSSVLDGFSEGSQRSKGGADSFDDFSLAAQSAETPHFH